MTSEETNPHSVADSSHHDGILKPAFYRREIVEQMINAHEMELMAAEKDVKHLREKRYELNELLNGTSHIMTSLPLDVLSEIFALVCERDPNYFEFSLLPGQFVIGGVCRVWRRIAWSMPYLWKHIFLAFSIDRYETQRTLLQDWIKRTADCSLHLHFSAPFMSKWEPPVDFFRVILQTCSRWATFEYRYQSTNFPLSLQHEPNPVFPLLSSLSLLGLPNPEYSGNALDKWNFSLPPQLRTLVVRCQRQFELDIHWGSLTDLTITAHIESLPAVLASSNSLTTLDITLLSPFGLFSTNGRIPSRTPRLKALSINGFPRNVGALIRLLTTPMLKDLDLEMFEDIDDDPSYRWDEDLANMARRSTFQLTSLTITQNTISREDDILDILCNMPSIERFVLDCSGVTSFSLSDHTIDQLNPCLQAAEDKGLGFLPNLTFFEYRGRISFTLDALERMIKTRFGSLQTRRKSSQQSIPGQMTTTDLDLDSKLRVGIIYSNVSWYRERHPNELQTLYTAIAPLWTRGLAFNLEWEPDEEDSREGE